MISAALFATLAILLAVPAAQAAPYEPNDSIPDASGPMVGGQNYDAAIETANDQDYFYFFVKGERQIDISLAQIGGDCWAEGVYLLYASDGREVSGGYADFPSNGTAAHITHSSGYSAQYVLHVSHPSGDSPGCQYRLRVDPADAITQSAPGLIAFLNDLNESDDTQRVLVDGVLAGSSTGTSGRVVELGNPPSGAQITYEAENASGRYSWDVELTNYQGRGETTIFKEAQSGGSSDSPRVGKVRRVVMSPSGGIIESCGEALAPMTCIPVDNDGDGSALPQDCDDTSASVHPGAVEVVDNEIDENCDGFVAKHSYFDSTTSLRRRGKSYSGRVRAGSPACLGGRRVALHRIGSKRALRTAQTRSSGTFTFKSKRRIRGQLWVSIGGRTSGLTVCRSTSSRIIKG